MARSPLRLQAWEILAIVAIVALAVTTAIEFRVVVHEEGLDWVTVSVIVRVVVVDAESGQPVVGARILPYPEMPTERTWPHPDFERDRPVRHGTKDSGADGRAEARSEPRWARPFSKRPVRGVALVECAGFLPVAVPWPEGTFVAADESAGADFFLDLGRVVLRRAPR